MKKYIAKFEVDIGITTKNIRDDKIASGISMCYDSFGFCRLTKNYGL